MLLVIKKLFLVSRPISWPNTAYPFAAAYLIAGGQLDLTFWLGVIYFLGPYNLLMYGINDVFDYESDIKNPRKGGIEGMREQKAFHPTIVRAAIISNLPFIIYFLAIGDWLSRLVFALVIFFVLAYSVANLRFKEKAVLDAATSSLHFVGPMIFGLCLTQFNADAWPYIIAFFLWGMASQAFGAVQDILPDRAGGIRSIATLFGARWTVRFAVTLYAAAALIMLVQPWPIAVIGIAGLLYVINCIRYIAISDADSGQTNPAWKRFIWLNFITGFVVTMVLITVSLT
jgi:4-hydroxybenzoate polyprenyltransferase